MKMKKENGAAKKTVRTFAVASFLNDMGSDMIYPIWPIFVTSFMGANMAVLGLIDGLGEALVSLSQAGSGYASDRLRKRKPFIWTGYIFGSLSRIGYAISSLWWHLIPFKVLDRVGKIRGAPRDAMLADISTDKNRGRNFGLLRMMDNLGAVAGILLCILLVDQIGYRTLFLIAAVPSLIGALLIFVMIKEKKDLKAKVFKGLSFKDLDRNFKLFFFLNGLFALGSFSYSFMIVLADEAGFKSMFVPVLYLLFTLVASLVSLPFGKLSDKIGRKPVMLLSFFLWVLMCISFIVHGSLLLVIIGFALYGLHKGALDPVQKTFVSELSPVERRASSLGGFQMVIGLCALPGSLLAGIIWDRFGSALPFMISMALTIVSFGLLLLVKERKGK